MERYLDGTLSFVGRMLSRHHLSKCNECAAKLESLKKDRDELKRLSSIMNDLDDADTKSYNVTCESVTQYFSTESAEDDEN